MAKNEKTQTKKNYFNYISIILSLNFLTKYKHPELQYLVCQCEIFRSDPKLPHNQTVKWVVKISRAPPNKALF